MSAEPNRSLSKTILTVFLFALLAVGVLASVQTVRAEAPGTWTQTTQYPFNAYGASCAQSSGTIVCVGGDDFSATTPGVVDTVEYASLSSSGISSWTATTAYPTVIYVPSCVTSGSYIYCVGGSDSQNVYYAQVSGSGIVGSWQSTTSYPIPIAGESCVTSGGYITCVGGTEDGASGDTQVVYSAPLENPGIGTWTEQTDFACTSSCESSGSTGIPTSLPACVVTGTTAVYITCIGGEEKIYVGGEVVYDYPQVGSAYSSTLSSGTVGSTWTSTTTLPQSTVSGAGSCVSSNGYVYCIAGYDEETGDTAVFYAQSSSGSLGSWTEAPDYGQAVSTQQCVVYSSDIYCTTGQENTALTPYSYYTTISGSSSTSTSSSTSSSSSSSTTSRSTTSSSASTRTLVCPSTAGGSLMPPGATFVDSYGNTWVAPSGNDGGGYWNSYFFAGPSSSVPPPMQMGWGGDYGTYNGQQGWVVTFYC